VKLKIFIAGLLVAGVGASAAVAAPPAGKGKPPATGATCKPKITVVLKGTVTSASAGSLSMSVTSGNRWARAYVTAGAASVTMDANTKVRRNGKKTASDLMSGDRVLVQARVCKAELDANATPGLTAVRVVAHPPKA
jgi:hypothetical protein